MSNQIITQEYIELIRDYPHLLGSLVGYDDLTEMHSDWALYLFNPERINRSLQAHRGSYKTSMLTVIGAIYWMLFHPNDTIGVIRKNFTDAHNCVKDIATIMKKEEVKALFHFAHGMKPRALINKAEKLVYNFKSTVTREGNINACGIMTSIVGKHFDVIICDDFVTIEDKISRATREKTKRMMEEIVANILNPSGLGVFIGTCWHKEDAWTLPIIPEPLKYDVYKTGILSSREIEEKRRMTTNATWAANYLLKHVANDDALFQHAKFGRWNQKYGAPIGHLDKKYFGSDTNALTFAMRNRETGRYNVIGWTFKENIKYKWAFIKEKWKKYGVGTMHTENNDDKGFSGDELIKQGIPVQTYHESTNKHVKIQTHLLENGFWDLIDFDPDTDPEYINQVIDYVEGAEPDDCPDGLASIGRILIGSGAHYASRWDNV